MPRNGSGTYSLPVPPFTPGTTILSADVNSDFSDMATAMTGSIAADGQTPITGQLKGAQGVSPTYSISGDLNTGFGSSSADTAYIQCGGTNVVAYSTTGVTVTGTLTVSSTLTASGNVTVAGTLGVTGNFAVNTNKFNVTASSGNTTIAGTLQITGALSGVTTLAMNGAISGLTAPTVQQFTSGSGTYTLPANCKRVRVRMVGGGGGGAARVTNAGGNGGTTSFESWTAVGGSGAPTTTAGGNGGTGGANGTGTLIVRCTGAKGGQGSDVSSSNSTEYAGGNGASSPFGGAGPGGQGGGGAGAGQAAAANTGSGGGGAGGSGNLSAGGGGAGEYVEFWMTAAQIGAGVSYAVGAAGTAGAAGTVAGGAGAAGTIVVEEFYA